MTPEARLSRYQLWQEQMEEELMTARKQEQILLAQLNALSAKRSMDAAIVQEQEQLLQAVRAAIAAKTAQWTQAHEAYIKERAASAPSNEQTLRDTVIGEMAESQEDWRKARQMNADAARAIDAVATSAPNAAALTRVAQAPRGAWTHYRRNDDGDAPKKPQARQKPQS